MPIYFGIPQDIHDCLVEGNARYETFYRKLLRVVPK
jgi:hypothetical protein